MATYYEQKIQEITGCAEEDAPAIEYVMREEHPLLGEIPIQIFIKAAKRAQKMLPAYRVRKLLPAYLLPKPKEPSDA
jgi:hypothetical protein